MEEFIKYERHQLRIAYNDPVNYPMAIRERDDLKLRIGIECDIKCLGKYSLKNVFVRKTQCGNELWVRSGYRGYRKAFKRYLQVYYQLIDGMFLYDVDHIVSRKIAKMNSLEFLRVTLVKHEYNISFGAKLEKVLCKRLTKIDVIDLDMFFLFKILDIPFPDSSIVLKEMFEAIAMKISKFSGEKIEYVCGHLAVRFFFDYKCILGYKADDVIELYKKYAIPIECYKAID